MLVEQIKTYRKEYYAKNRDRILAQQRGYYLSNKKQIITQHNEYLKNKLKTDINYKILHNLRSRLNLALNGKVKSKNTLNLLGCSIDELKAHLQSKFIEGMQWNNHGQWHIDHVIPCSKFDLTKEAEQQKCFHYSNLQPLWAIDNIKKSNNI